MRVAQFRVIYGNLTTAAAEAALASLHTDLNTIAVTLVGLQVTPSQLDALNVTLMQVCWAPLGYMAMICTCCSVYVDGTGMQQ